MNQLCWHYHLMDRDDQDRDVAVEQSSLLQKRMEGNIEFLSFDRGFHSPKNQIDKKTPRRRVLPPAILTAANRKTKIAKNESFAPIEGNKTTTLLKTKISPPPPPRNIIQKYRRHSKRRFSVQRLVMVCLSHQCDSETSEELIYYVSSL